MRKVIAVRSSDFDLEIVSPQIEAIANLFAEYVSKSKNQNRLEIVNMILKKCLTLGLDKSALMGYAILAHDRAHDFELDKETLHTLEEAISQLVQLIDISSLNLAPKVVERIRYQLNARTRS